MPTHPDSVGDVSTALTGEQTEGRNEMDFSSLSDWANLGQVLGGFAQVIAVALILFAAKQLQAQKASSKSQVLFQLDEALAKYQDIHQSLRPVGQWGNNKGGPTGDDWPAVEAYMGLFERLKAFIDDGLVDTDTAFKLYAYRVFNVNNNATIHDAKLVGNRAQYWQDFLALLEIFEAEEKKRRSS
jgi:hypothetical protein